MESSFNVAPEPVTSELTCLGRIRGVRHIMIRLGTTLFSLTRHAGTNYFLYFPTAVLPNPYDEYDSFENDRRNVQRPSTAGVHRPNGFQHYPCPCRSCRQARQVPVSCRHHPTTARAQVYCRRLHLPLPHHAGSILDNLDARSRVSL